MPARIFGDTSNLKASQAKALARLHERRVPPDQLVSQPLARELVELARELHRRVGVYLDRRGRVTNVILGDASSMGLPEFERVRGAGMRLRGVRLVTTHLLPDPLDREELADLSKLRLDLIAALHEGAAGVQVDVAVLRPGRNVGRAFEVDVLPRAPIGHVAPADARRVPDRADLPYPLREFLRELDVALDARASAARRESGKTRAMVLQVHPGGGDLEARKSELRELCRTAGVDVVDIVTQKRSRPDPRTFMGKGKLREVLVRALEQDVELLICDPELSPSQAREIARQTDLKVIDRTILILDIFAQHAQSSDGKLQVELAQQRYRLPRLVGKGTMMSRLMGGVGGRGPGESKLEVDRRRAQRRITDLERRLSKMKKQREQRRSRRRRADVPAVAIVGYTNAGKSTLLNAITRSDVRAEDKLFATLDPTVRRIRFPAERELVLLDTVGFIRDLPPALMQAFSATLEEMRDASLLLHVIDVVDPDGEAQISTVEGILDELELDDIPRLLVFNKCDLLEGDPPPNEGDRFYVSAHRRSTAAPLVAEIERRLWRGPASPAIEASGVAEEAGDEPEQESDGEGDDADRSEERADP